MYKSKAKKLKGKQLVKRLTGISTPIGGINWTPPIDERDVAKQLLVYLEDRRALYLLFEQEVGPYVTKSIIEIRQRLTKDLEKISRSSVLGESLSAMRASCSKYLTVSQDDLQRWSFVQLSGFLWQSLGELRAICGLHIARIACAYDLTIEEQLMSMLPAEHDKECSE